MTKKTALLLILFVFMAMRISATTTDNKELTTDTITTGMTADPIPAEHDISYTILSQKNYNVFSFLRHYMGIAKKEMKGMKGNAMSSGGMMKGLMKKEKGKQRPIINVLRGKYHTAVIKYPTTDIDGKPIETSALLLWHNRKQINEVLYTNHGTRVGNIDAPTDGFSPEIFFCTSGALIIMPDYIGAGITHDRSEPYLVAQHNGDVAVDGYLAGLKFAKENIKNFSADYNGYIIGYSEGGSVSLAALRSLQQRSEERQKMLNVKRVVCGDGPYDLGATFETYLKEDSMLLPLVIPLAINGIMTGYPDSVKTLKYEECFTDTALATGIPQTIRANNGSTMQLLSFNKKVKCAKDVLSDKIMGMNTPEYRRLFSLLERQNLCKGWEPKYPVLFFHDKGDTIVPFINMEHAVQGLKNEYVMDPIILDEGNDHFGGMGFMLKNVMLGKLYK